MKAIPKTELIKLLQHIDIIDMDDLLFSEDLQDIFEIFGDDYFIDRTFSEWTLCKANKERKEFLIKTGEEE